MSMGATWSIPMDKFIGKAQANLDTVARKIVLTGFRRVIMRTPVKTGRARGNWQASVGSAASGELDRTNNIPVNQPGGSAWADVYQESKGWNPLKGKTFYLVNNLPYIGVLEHGRIGNHGSDQAPNGMVRITVAELGGIAQDAANGTLTGGPGE